MDVAWRGPRWWHRYRGLDPRQYQKLEYFRSVFAGVVCLALGIWLVASGLQVVGGVILTCLGVCALWLGIMLLRQGRR